MLVCAHCDEDITHDILVEHRGGVARTFYKEHSPLLVGFDEVSTEAEGGEDVIVCPACYSEVTEEQRKHYIANGVKVYNDRE